MRIGMMLDVYKPHVSGVTNYVALNKRYLEKKGHEITVFTFGDGDYVDDESNVIRSPGLPLIDTGYYLGINYSTEARRLLEKMDIAHVHHPFISGMIALRLCRPKGIPIVFTNHTRYDLYAQAYLPALADIIGETMVQAYLPAFCRACDLVIAPSAGMKDVLLRLGVDSPVEVLPNGVDFNLLSQPQNLSDRSSLGFSPQEVVILYVGRLGPEKNLPFLLRSFAGTAQAYEGVRLMLVGDGPERDDLEKLAEDLHVRPLVLFTGMVEYGDIPRYLAAGDIFATASVTEVHPLSVIEAMAAGMPVLGILSPGVGDIVQDGVTGFLATEDLAAFTAKLVRLVSDSDLRRSLGINARKLAQDYAIERTTGLLLARYQQLFDQSAKRNHGLRSRIARFTRRSRG
jgi:1,2-diacylglycerol 3-alpha-glucosyltransferase